MSLEEAMRAALAAQAKAEELKLNVSIAVVDVAGDLIYFSRMDEAHHGSIDFAIAKARCAARTRRRTSDWETRLKSEPGVATLPGILALAGGVHLADGGIGVSGARPAEDEMCAEAASSSFKA